MEHKVKHTASSSSSKKITSAKSHKTTFSTHGNKLSPISDHSGAKLDSMISHGSKSKSHKHGVGISSHASGHRSGGRSRKASRHRIHKLKAKEIEAVVISTDDDSEIPHLPPECCEGYTDDKRKENDSMRNRMSVPWFQTINLSPERQKDICFSESLLMVDEIGRIAGKMYTIVSQAKWGEQHCLCIHSGSFGTLSDGMECGTTITGFVSPELKTVQEYVYEWATSGGKVIERKTFIMREEETIHVRIVLIKDGETAETKVVTLGRLELQNLVTESSNIILLRLIMLERRTMGGMDLKTLTFTGTVVKNKYVELGNGWENIKGEQMRTWSIRRTVEFDFGDRLWDSMLNQHGRLVLRCQPENTHALIPLWFEPVKQFKDGKFISSYPPYVWACDAELHTKYLLKKDELAAQHRIYLLDHPELRGLLSDFLQSLLLRKPPQVIPFAQQYFESFLKFQPESHPTTAFSSSSSPSTTTMGTVEQGENGESWSGSGEDNNSSKQYYPIRPTLSDDGFEKIFPEEELITDKPNQQNPDENVSIGPDGKYITTVIQKLQ